MGCSTSSRRCYQCKEEMDSDKNVRYAGICFYCNKPFCTRCFVDKDLYKSTKACSKCVSKHLTCNKCHGMVDVNGGNCGHCPTKKGEMLFCNQCICKDVFGGGQACTPCANKKFKCRGKECENISDQNGGICQICQKSILFAFDNGNDFNPTTQTSNALYCSHCIKKGDFHGGYNSACKECIERHLTCHGCKNIIKKGDVWSSSQTNCKRCGKLFCKDCMGVVLTVPVCAPCAEEYMKEKAGQLGRGLKSGARKMGRFFGLTRQRSLSF